MVSSIRISGSFVLAYALVLCACSSKLTRDRAEALIQSSEPFAGAALTISPQPKEACGSRPTADYENILGQRLPPPDAKNILQGLNQGGMLEELEMGLIEVTFDQIPMRSKAVPAICQTEHNKRFDNVFDLYVANWELIHWKVKVSAKARQAGVPEAGGVFKTHKKKMLGVSGLRPIDENNMLAEYTWLWETTELGTKLGLPAHFGSPAEAAFRRYDDGWRLVR